MMSGASLVSNHVPFFVSAVWHKASSLSMRLIESLEQLDISVSFLRR
jgi:hypothetical protein